MKLIQKIAHLVFPRESNNQKAKLLHLDSLSLIALFLIIFQLGLTYFPKFGPRVLGYAANISPAEVIRLTNEKRLAAGLPALESNSVLSQAAQAKGADMLNKGYWAHISPDGTQPWKFFIDFGYKYRYAGENLARDFSNPASAVEAWMNSPSHKENMLNPKYKDIGVAVVEGNLAGIDTTIIVQFFGTKYVDTVPAVPLAEAKPATTNFGPSPSIAPAPGPGQPAVESAPSPTPFQRFLISPFNTTKSLSLTVVGVLLGVLVIDGIATSRRKIVRIGGRTFAHIAFLGMILAIALLLKAGQVI